MESKKGNAVPDPDFNTANQRFMESYAIIREDVKKIIVKHGVGEGGLNFHKQVPISDEFRPKMKTCLDRFILIDTKFSESELGGFLKVPDKRKKLMTIRELLQCTFGRASLEFESQQLALTSFHSKVTPQSMHRDTTSREMNFLLRPYFEEFMGTVMAGLRSARLNPSSSLDGNKPEEHRKKQATKAPKDIVGCSECSTTSASHRIVKKELDEKKHHLELCRAKLEQLEIETTKLAVKSAEKEDKNRKTKIEELSKASSEKTKKINHLGRLVKEAEEREMSGELEKLQCRLSELKEMCSTEDNQNERSEQMVDEQELEQAEIFYEEFKRSYFIEKAPIEDALANKESVKAEIEIEQKLNIKRKLFIEHHELVRHNNGSEQFVANMRERINALENDEFKMQANAELEKYYDQFKACRDVIVYNINTYKKPNGLSFLKPTPPFPVFCSVTEKQITARLEQRYVSQPPAEIGDEKSGMSQSSLEGFAHYKCDFCHTKVPENFTYCLPKHALTGTEVTTLLAPLKSTLSQKILSKSL